MKLIISVSLIQPYSPEEHEMINNIEDAISDSLTKLLPKEPKSYSIEQVGNRKIFIEFTGE